MIKLNWYQCKAILWKEAKETTRVSKFTALLWIGAMICVLVVPIAKVMKDESIPSEAKGLVLGSMAPAIPMMLIPVLGQIIVTKSIYEERKRKTIQTLMAQGVSPSIIWFGKFGSAVMFAYTTAVISGIFYMLLVKAVTGTFIILTGRMLYVTLFVSPVISASTLAVISSCYLVLKQPRLLGVAYFMGVFYGMFYVVSRVTGVNLSIIASSLVLALGISLLVVSAGIAGMISKERIADI